MRTLSITPEVTALTSCVELPGLGGLAVNSFLIMGDEPMLVDTGITPERDEFMGALRELIDPADLRWIWLTHADRDHTGSLSELLVEAPNATLVSTFITLGLMSTGNQPIPPERAYLVRHGTRVSVGGRELQALRPPLFDNPGTAGFFDRASGVLFSSDFLGAAVPSVEHGFAPDVAEIAEDDVAGGQLLWGSVDSPWAHSLDESKFAATLAEFGALDPQIVLSTHLPPIRGNLDRHLKTISMLPGSDPTVMPDQAAMEAMMNEIAHGA